MSTQTQQKPQSLTRRVIDLYVDGFRNMTIGKSLWALILIKLFVMFAILKIFFFPDALGKYSDNSEKADAVRNSLIEKNIPIIIKT